MVLIKTIRSLWLRIYDALSRLASVFGCASMMLYQDSQESLAEHLWCLSGFSEVFCWAFMLPITTFRSLLLSIYDGYQDLQESFAEHLWWLSRPSGVFCWASMMLIKTFKSLLMSIYDAYQDRQKSLAENLWCFIRTLRIFCWASMMFYQDPQESLAEHLWYLSGFSGGFRWLRYTRPFRACTISRTQVSCPTSHPPSRPYIVSRGMQSSWVGTNKTRSVFANLFSDRHHGSLSLHG